MKFAPVLKLRTCQNCEVRFRILSSLTKACIPFVAIEGEAERNTILLDLRTFKPVTLGCRRFSLVLAQIKDVYGSPSWDDRRRLPGFSRRCCVEAQKCNPGDSVRAEGSTVSLTSHDVVLELPCLLGLLFKKSRFI